VRTQQACFHRARPACYVLLLPGGASYKEQSGKEGEGVEANVTVQVEEDGELGGVTARYRMMSLVCILSNMSKFSSIGGHCNAFSQVDDRPTDRPPFWAVGRCLAGLAQKTRREESSCPPARRTHQKQTIFPHPSAQHTPVSMLSYCCHFDEQKVPEPHMPEQIIVRSSNARVGGETKMGLGAP
jgi:hypothetical protein